MTLSLMEVSPASSMASELLGISCPGLLHFLRQRRVELFQLRLQVSDASSPASAPPGVSSLGRLPYQPQGRGGLVQAASVEQQASGTMAGLLGAPETSRRLLAGRVRAPPAYRLLSAGPRGLSL